MLKFIQLLSGASNGTMDESLASECASFASTEHTEEECVKFLRNLKDKCVRYGGSSGFIIQSISALLSNQPEENPAEQEARRTEILLQEHNSKLPTKTVLL